MKFILTRTFILYTACFLLIWHILDYHKLIGNAIPTTMSRFTPPIDYFSEFVDRQGPYDRFALMECAYYHQAVVRFFPYQKAESYGMLGFCYERSGETSQAINYYQQAIAANPYYFWPYYDLGVIYYKEGQYLKAANYFQQAIEQNPVKTIILLSRSKVYMDVKLSKGTQPPYDFLQSLKQGHTSAYILMLDSLSKSGSYALLWKATAEGLKLDQDTQGIFYYYAAVAAFDLRSYQRSIELLQAALRIDPRNADAILYLGMCLQQAGKTDMARLLMAQAAQMQKQGGSVLEQYLKPRVRFF